MRRGLIIAGLCALVLTLPAPVATPSPAQSVSMSFTRFYDNACRCYKARVSGQVSSGRAGEYVVVLRQYCPLTFGTAVAGATTREGGFWEAEIAPVPGPDAPATETYRARWEGRLSAPVTLRSRLAVFGISLPQRRQRISVDAGGNNPVNLNGKAVVLQRRAGGGWTRVASARLKPDTTRPNAFSVTVTVPRRGWKLRALVPKKSAAPCYPASVSDTWTS